MLAAAVITAVITAVVAAVVAAAVLFAAMVVAEPAASWCALLSYIYLQGPVASPGSGKIFGFRLNIKLSSVSKGSGFFWILHRR